MYTTTVGELTGQKTALHNMIQRYFPMEKQMSQQCILVAKVDNYMLDCISNSSQRQRKASLSLYLALERLLL